MLKRIQLIVFLTILCIVLFATRQYWESWVVGVFSILFSLSAFFIAVVIFFENRNPTKTVTWLVVLGTFPIVGFFFYLMFGQNVRKRKSFNKKAIEDEQAFHHMEGNRPLDETKLKRMSDHQQKLFRLANKIGNNPISFQTETKVLTDGKETFTYIVEALKKAENHIHLEYYIVRHDEIGQEIKQILIDKAKAGVAVRFLYDSVGSWKLNNDYVEEMRQAGVKIVPFSPVKFPLFNHRINYRNHRKIIVVDTTYAFIGGLNIGDEYLGKNRYFGHWRDTHLFVQGEAIRSLQLIFLRDWYYETKENAFHQNYLSPSLASKPDDGGVQMIASGPDSRWEILKKLFFTMITSANKSIWIASPYFIPDEDILSALKIAALSGVDVRILVPNRPDKRIVFYASRSYFPELLEAGVKIYEYNRGFMHSKLIIVDHEIASIGTANMDMRSFHLNFEVNAFLYQTSSVERLVSDFIYDMEHSTVIREDVFKNRSFSHKVIESTSRLLSPLL
ncbi:cardiolipin synthase [Evansella cellulosilytica]|uniref:Cardiolipin synthase n=1 Tax=Evansella cellulosilytica (strain ATCC 21833 / DSM 2522 / FERM P-1141 / JCM 9156 / N-4) TaxID=649639 RepID=E6TX64_EVAC2|nr:cardiolipin synthase [Evansella cellulosilytica]ADU31153.1 phospholipase D/Transphosphatidylase [Evansella cellulosilytica DSM 2522]